EQEAAEIMAEAFAACNALIAETTPSLGLVASYAAIGSFLAERHIAAGDGGDAREIADTASRLLDALGEEGNGATDRSRNAAVRVRALQARVAQANGETEAAGKHCGEALVMLRIQAKDFGAKGYFDVGDAAEYAELLVQCGDKDEAR